MSVTNLAVTGPRGSGKSKMVRSLLASISGPVTLIETVPLVVQGRVRGYGIRGPDEIVHPFAHEAWHRHPRFMRYGYDAGVFNNFAPVLEAALQSAAVVAIDELGVMEEEAEEFRRVVSRVLDAQAPVLLAVKEEFVGELIGALMNRPDTCVWSLSQLSWEQVRFEMSQRLASMLGA